MTTRIVKAFEKEVNLTEEGIAILVENKKSLVIEFNTKAGMTLARKERTERNKLIEQVKRASIDTENAIKAKRASIIEQITTAYNCIVEPFEKEELRLKQEKERLAKIEEERIDAIRAKIGTIRNFSLGLTGKTSQELSEIIEAVDMIDVEESFAEFTQEAMQVKKETLGELNITLSGAIQSEQLAEDQKKVRIQERLNNLMMIPTGFFGKPASDIQKKIVSLKAYEVPAEEFGSLYETAKTSVVNVISQLEMMYRQQLTVEQAQAQQSEPPLVEKPVSKPENIQLAPAAKKGETITKTDGGFTTQTELTKHEEMIKHVKFWASEYGVINSELSDLMNILNRYK